MSGRSQMTAMNGKRPSSIPSRHQSETHGIQYPENWICVIINHIVILLIIEMEHLLHTIKNENLIHNSRILSRSTLKPGGDNELFKVSLGMQIPSARLIVLIIIEHSQIGIRNRRDKFRAAGEETFSISRNN